MLILLLTHPQIDKEMREETSEQIPFVLVPAFPEPPVAAGLTSAPPNDAGSLPVSETCTQTPQITFIQAFYYHMYSYFIFKFSGTFLTFS
jgi:hypothetical protein